MSNAIEAEGLTKLYGGDTSDEVHALRGVDLAVPEGGIYGYLGRNGQGKSTTVRILTGLALPTTGSATVAGLDVVADRKAVQSQIGVTLQDVALDDLQTGREHLALVASLWGHDRRTARRLADDLLEEFGLTDAATRLIRNYSGGMRRRLDLATSLLNDPTVLFLDEPTTGLDPQSRRTLWNRIRRLRAGGATVFLTTQYLEEADELADELAIIDAGTIVAKGSPEQLRATYGTTRIEVRVDDDALRRRLAATMASEVATVEDDGNWLRAELADTGHAARLVTRLDRSGPRGEPQAVIDEIGVHTSSLEDVFLDLTGSGINGNGRVGNRSPNVATEEHEGVAA